MWQKVRQNHSKSYHHMVQEEKVPLIPLVNKLWTLSKGKQTHEWVTGHLFVQPIDREDSKNTLS